MDTLVAAMSATLAPLELTAAKHDPSTLLEISGGRLLGWLKGIAIVAAIIGILIIAGKMVAAHWQSSGNKAAEGASEIPWVLLSLVLISASTAITTELLTPAESNQGSSSKVVDQYKDSNPPGGDNDDD